MARAIAALRIARLDRPIERGNCNALDLLLVTAAALPDRRGAAAEETADARRYCRQLRPPSAWKTIPADDLLVMDLANGGRVVIQLAPPSRPSTSPTSGRWRAATIGMARPSTGCRTIMSRNGALTRATSRGRRASTAKPPAEYTRPLKGLTVTPLGSPDPYAPGAGFADGWPVAYNRKAGWADLDPLLRQRRRRPRPVARHRHRRRTLRGHRPCAAPARPQSSRSSAGSSTASTV